MAGQNSFKDSMKQNPFSGGGLPSASGLGNISDNIQEFVNEHKVESLLIAVTAGFLIFTYMVVSDRTAKMQMLQSEITVLKEKDEPSQDYRRAQKKTEQFLKDIPEAIPESRFVVMLTQLADKRSIRIASFNPPKVQRQSFYNDITVQLSFFAPSFRDGMFFLKDIESLPFSMRVMSMAVKASLDNSVRGMMGGAGAPSLDQPVEMNVTLSSVSLIEYDKKTLKNK